MSLKAFHIFFILLSIGISLFFGLWTSGPNNQSSFVQWLGILSLVASLALSIYLYYFVAKIRKMSGKS